MTAPRLTRRSFLALLGVAGLGGSAVAVRLLLDEDGASRSTGAASNAAALFDDPDAARRLGAAYLDGHGRENDRTVLIGLLQRNSVVLHGRDPDALGTLAARRVAEELRSGDFVEVEGWYMAPTEARLCALLAAA